jgi:acyl-CoA thioester hydrolase
MPRLRDDANRLSRQAYPRLFEMRASYGDVDSFQHLNNVALARYLEEGRASLNMEVFGIDAVVRPSLGVQLLFASIEIDYVSQGLYPGVITVATAISRIGRSSFVHASALFQNDNCVALCDAVTVHAVNGKGLDLPPEIRAGLEGLMIRN